MRPRFNDPNRKSELVFAEATFVKKYGTWKVYWMRGNLKWYPYVPHTVKTWRAFLKLVDEDKHNCFFG